MRTWVARTLGVTVFATVALASLGGPVAADEAVSTSFPEDFPEILDASLGTPVIGFGASGPVSRTPVVFLHGNNDTPYPTPCNGGFGHMLDFAQWFHDNGYARSELWGLGYQGEQCDILVDPSLKSGEAHTAAANVADVRAFVHAVLDHTGAEQVDVVGHSLGGIVPREWMRQDDAHHLVRRLVMVDSPNHGIINCSPSPRNYFAPSAAGGFSPDSGICVEFGAADTPFLEALNADPTPGPTRYLVIRNADTSFVYFPEQDGAFPPVPAENRRGEPHDFSHSAELPGVPVVDLTGQGIHDTALLTAHIGISNSPDAFAAAFDFLTAPDDAPAPDDGASTSDEVPAGVEDPTPTPEEGRPAPSPLPATGAGAGWAIGVVAVALLVRRRPIRSA